MEYIGSERITMAYVSLACACDSIISNKEKFNKVKVHDVGDQLTSSPLCPQNDPAEYII